MNTLTYQEFILSKIPRAQQMGFTPASAPHVSLFPHQVDVARWMIAGGRRACFKAFGLGKTRTHLQVALWVCEAVPTKKFLITCPLGVRHQFLQEDGPAMNVSMTFCRTDAEIDAAPTQIVITNYESVREGKIMIDDRFAGWGLDEASCLRSFGSKTYQNLLKLGEAVKYRFAFTATPSPNRHKELIHYAGFLGVMDTGQALTRFFKRDSQKAGNLTLYPHMGEQFWEWLSSWAVWMQKPSDLGYSDAGYDLPPMKVHWHCVSVDHKKAWQQIDSWGQRQLFLDKSSGLKDIAEVKRETIIARIAEMIRILSRYDKFIEQKAIHGRVVSAKQIQSKIQQSQILSSEQGQKYPTGDTVAGEQSRTSLEASTGISRPQSREVKSRKSRLVSSKQTSRGTAKQEAETQTLRVDRGNSRSVNKETERGLCDLPAEASCARKTNKSSHRPLPQDEQGARPPLRALQFCSGDDERRSIVAKACSGISDQFIIWCELNEEQRAAAQLLKTLEIPVASIHGSQNIDDREEILYDWSAGQSSVLISKPVLLGSGCNLQHNCCTMIFLGASYKFNDVVQSIHRIFRFQQKRQVNIHFIYSESEDQVIASLKTKWAQHNELVAKMSSILRKFKLDLKNMQITRTLGCDRVEMASDKFRAINNDCVVELATWSDNQVDEIVTSIPFGNQYEYSPAFEDFGHNPSNEDFFKQMGYAVPHWYRVLKPGRLACIHVKDRIRFGAQHGTGVPTVDRFSDKTADCFEKHGFFFLGRITIDTDVVRENAQTYRLGWSENSKDSTKMGVGMPEYVLLFRKPHSDLTAAYADLPVTKDKSIYLRADWQIDAESFWKSDGNRLPDPEILSGMPMDNLGRLWREHCRKSRYKWKEHVEVCKELETRGRLPASFMLFPPISNHPGIWTDIARMRVLNSEQSKRNEEHHVCPLQLDIVNRLIQRYSNPGEIVLDPFAGIFTVPYQAIHLGRIGWGIELSHEYWRCGVGYCEQAERDHSMPTLFDLKAQGAEVIAA